MDLEKKRGFAAWREVARFVLRQFSIWPLLKTLLVPFRRESFSSGGVKSTFAENIIFNLLMRFIGAVARVFIIVCGLVALTFSILLLPIFVLLHLSINPERLNRHRAF